MRIKWNYLIGSDCKIDKDYDVRNRPDPDSACKKLYDDIIEIFFQNGPISGRNYKVENMEKQYQWKPKFGSPKRHWENYRRVNNITKPCDEGMDAPFYTIKVTEAGEGKGKKEWLLSADYIGPSINWTLDQNRLSKEDVAGILSICRTIGGHIVWPRGSDLKLKINTERGGEKCVYDRIDWTLYVLKACYECSFNNKDVENKINKEVGETYKNELLGRIARLIEAICESECWFKKFGSFNRFCDQFLLKGSFVSETYEVNWFAEILPILPVDYKQFALNNAKAVERRNCRILASMYGKIVDNLFCDGGEIYSLKEIERKFAEAGIVGEDDFNDALADCISQGWIVEFGDGVYTR